MCDGSQQVSDSGFGLLDDEAQPVCGGRHRSRAAAALHPAQPRLPQAAQSPGHLTAGGADEAERREARPRTLESFVCVKDTCDSFCFYKYWKNGLFLKGFLLKDSQETQEVKKISIQQAQFLFILMWVNVMIMWCRVVFLTLRYSRVLILCKCYIVELKETISYS